MNTRNISLFAVAALLTIFSGCKKTDYVAPQPTPIPATPTPAPPVACYNATPETLTRKNAAMLCSSSEGRATVDNCFNSTPLGITDGQASLVCAGRADDLPVQCINDPVISALDNFNAAVLCSYAGSSTDQTTCFNNSSLSLYDNEAAVMCQGATSAVAPNNCYADTSFTDLTETNAATLCSQTRDNGSSVIGCYNLTPSTLPQEDAAILCQKTTNPSATLDCFYNSPAALTDHEAAILCSGYSNSANSGSNTLVAQCWNNSSSDLTNLDAAYQCSGSGSIHDVQYANRCFGTTSVSLGEHDAAVLCSQNTGLLTSMYSVNTQYANRATGSGVSNSRGLVAIGDLETSDLVLRKAKIAQRGTNGGRSTARLAMKSVAKRGSSPTAKDARKLHAETNRVHQNRHGLAGAGQRSNKAKRSTAKNHTILQDVIVGKFDNK